MVIADANNARVRVVSPTGVITTAMGNGFLSYSGDNGPATSAALYEPLGVASTSDGSVVFSDSLNHAIRKVTADGVVHLVAGTPGVTGYTGDGGPAIGATFLFPTGVAVAPDGTIFVADSGNNVVRRITTNGIISTVAGTGVAGYSGDGAAATSALLSNPRGVTVGAAGVIYVADTTNARVRRVAATGVITTVAGTGVAGFNSDGIPATQAMLNEPIGLTVANNRLYIADASNHRVRAVDLATSQISTFAGTGVRGSSPTGVAATSSMLNHPAGLAIAPAGDVYIADLGNCVVRRVQTNGKMTVAAGAPPAKGVTRFCDFAEEGQPPYGVTVFNNPSSIALLPDGSLAVADSINHRLRLVTGL